MLATFVKIRLDCRAAENVALAGGEPVSLRDKPVIKIIEN
jgi:hypothetical protein